MSHLSAILALFHEGFNGLERDGETVPRVGELRTGSSPRINHRLPHLQRRWGTQPAADGPPYCVFSSAGRDGIDFCHRLLGLVSEMVWCAESNRLAGRSLRTYGWFLFFLGGQSR